MMVLTRFWRSLTKKDVLRVLDMNYKLKNNNFYRYPSFRAFFHGPGFFRIESKLLADPDPDSENKV